jgi:hypothetical protein
MSKTAKTALDKAQSISGLTPEIIILLPLINETLSALKAAGLDPFEVFNSLISEAYKQKDNHHDAG